MHSQAVLVATVTEKATGKQWQVYKQYSDKADGSFHYLYEQVSNGLAIDCSCGNRVHRGRKAGRACKHMLRFNAQRKAEHAAKRLAEQMASQKTPTIDYGQRGVLNGQRGFSLYR